MSELNATATMSNVLSASATFSQVVQGAEPPTGDATVDQVLAGATFSNATENGITGTMPDRGTVNIIPTAEDQAIPEGYHSGSGVVSGAPIAEAKAALDAANEEASADLTAGIALVESNYSDIKDAITAKGIDMTGVKPSDYDGKITEAAELAAHEALFAFNDATKTLLPFGYNAFGSADGDTDMVIPAAIRGVDVEILAADFGRYISTQPRKITSVYMPDSVKTITGSATSPPGYTFYQQNVASIRFSENVALTTIPFNFLGSGFSGTALSIPANIKTIGGQSFYNSPNLAELSCIGASTIGQLAFSLAPITKIIIGAGCAITEAADARYTMGLYGNSFLTLYSGNGKLAGTYEYSGGSWSKTA